MKLYLFILVGLFVFASCEKVIDIGVDDMEAQMVIEANYDAVNELVTVKISKTRNVFGTSVIPMVTGALVEIADESGNVEVLNEIQDGVYELTGYSPIYESNYNMKVTVNGEIFETNAYLPEVVELDSLFTVLEPASLFGAEGHVLYMAFNDPPGNNFYRAIRIINSDTLPTLEGRFLFDDSFSEGNYQEVPFFSSRYEIGDTLSVELRSYSEESYIYYVELFAIATDNGQSAAPANPNSSWSNGALGHFAAWGFDKKTIVVE